MLVEVGQPAIAHPFWEFQWQEVNHLEVAACSVVLFFSGVLCSAAGIGGGGVFVALLMVVGKLSPHNAVPLSKAIVFFGSISSLIVNIRRIRSSDAGGRRLDAKPVIDFNACRAVVPAALFGTYLGVVLNLHAKDHTIVVLLAMLLTLMTGLVLQTAWKQHCQEEAAAASAAARSLISSVVVPRPTGKSYSSSSEDKVKRHHESGSSLMRESQQNFQSFDEDGEDAPLLPHAEKPGVPPTEYRHIRARENEPIAADSLLAAALMFVVVMSGVLRFHLQACHAERQGQGAAGSCQHPVVAALFGGRLEFWMGDERMASGLERAVTTLPLWSCLALAVYFGMHAHQHGRWRVSRVVTYQVTATITGVLAGLVGVGGGLILSPFFLLTGMEPSAAVGTSATCVLFTSSSTTIQYVFTDRIIMPLALAYGAVTLIASYTGTSLVHHLQDQFAGKRSYITVIVAIGVALSAVLSVTKFLLEPSTA